MGDLVLLSCRCRLVRFRPIVVPRNHEFDEHVNNHQIDFCRKVAERQKNIIVVEQIYELRNIVENYDNTVESMKNGLTSNNERFCREFEKIIEELMRET